MNKKNKVVHVELSEPYQGKDNWYFGSVAAIYQELPKEAVGVSEVYLRRKLKQEGWYKSSMGTVIRKGILISKEHRL